jgi:hypothetical protein
MNWDEVEPGDYLTMTRTAIRRSYTIQALLARWYDGSETHGAEQVTRGIMSLMRCMRRLTKQG